MNEQEAGAAETEDSPPERREKIIDRVLNAAMHCRPAIDAGDIWRLIQPEIARLCGSLGKAKLHAAG